MLSGYVPFLFGPVVVITAFGSIGAVDGWLKALTNNRRPYCAAWIGFLIGCGKGAALLIVFTFIVLYV